MSLRVTRANWLKDNTTIRHIRYLVFVEEQAVPLEEEIDGRDPQCTHVLAYDLKDVAVGTGRLHPNGQIGRMAVLKEARGRSVGTALLNELLVAASEMGLSEVMLHSQVDAIPFYEKHRFSVTGGTFMDAGIPHREMRRRIQPHLRPRVDTPRAPPAEPPMAVPATSTDAPLLPPPEPEPLDD